jgi:hypothetical protein
MDTRRAVVVGLLGIALAIGLVEAVGAVGVLLAFGIAWAVVAVAAHAWEGRTYPATPAFARRQASGGSGAMLRRDSNAGFRRDRGGFLWRERHWFAATGCPPVELTAYAELAARHAHEDEPVAIARAGERQWWWWKESFYWETGDYTATDVKALLFQRERRRQRQLEHAHMLMAIEEAPAPVRRREPIPDDVKRLVFQRDEGRCQHCGGSELLQFDHIIPFTMGGSHEPENLQLLCARCNREKGGRL